VAQNVPTKFDVLFHLKDEAWKSESNIVQIGILSYLYYDVYIVFALNFDFVSAISSQILTPHFGGYHLG
jgi:hypothetical protein